MVRTLLYIIQAVGEEVIEQQLRHLTKKSSSSSSSSSSGKTSGTKTGSGSKKHKSEGIDIDIDVDHDCDYDDCNYDEGEEETSWTTILVICIAWLVLLCIIILCWKAYKNRKAGIKNSRSVEAAKGYSTMNPEQNDMAIEGGAPEVPEKEYSQTDEPTLRLDLKASDVKV